MRAFALLLGLWCGTACAGQTTFEVFYDKTTGALRTMVVPDDDKELPAFEMQAQNTGQAGLRLPIGQLRPITPAFQANLQQTIYSSTGLAPALPAAPLPMTPEQAQALVAFHAKNPLGAAKLQSLLSSLSAADGAVLRAAIAAHAKASQ